jgi:outer membrane protein assembly factor BamB
MPNAEDISAVYCPSCGASIQMDGAKGTCMYCGTAVERSRPAAGASDARRGYLPRPSYPAYRPSAAPRRGIAGMFLLLSLVLLIGFAILIGVTRGLFTRLVGTPSLPSSLTELQSATREPISQIAAALPRDGKDYDLLAYLNNPAGDGYFLALIEGGSHALRWKSQLLSKQAQSGFLTPGPGMVYLTDESRLLALRLSDGTPAWQTSLVAEPPSGCEGCLSVLKGRVVVLQKDGSLQAFDAASGQLAWSLRLEGTPRRLPVVGGRLVVLQPIEKNRGALVQLLDPSSGKPAQTIEPRCPSTHFPGQEERPDSSDPLLFSPDGGTLYSLFGFFNQCAQRWDLAAGKRVWQMPIEGDAVSPNWHDAHPLLADNAIFISSDRGGEHTIWALSSAGGKFRQIAHEKDNYLIPVAARDGILVVLAWPSWDSSRQALWGLDAATGERRWQFVPQAKDARFTDVFGNWDWRLGAKGLTVIQVLDDQKQLISEILDLKTGVSSARQVTALKGPGSQTWWRVTWADDMAWLDIGSSIYAVDLTTGATAYQLN